METTNTTNETTQPEEICTGIDIAFVIDATGSMSSYIHEAKCSVKNIIETTEKSLKESFPDNYQDLLKFSIIAYRDHPPEDSTFVTELIDFGNSVKALEYLSTLSASGGGDFPEAAMDGMHDAANKISWRKNTEKMLFLILDAPPHGIRYGTDHDCICGYTEKDFMPFFAKNEVKIHIIKPSGVEGVNKMIKIFEEFCPVDVKDFSGNQTSYESSSHSYPESELLGGYIEEECDEVKINCEDKFSDPSLNCLSDCKDMKVAEKNLNCLDLEDFEAENSCSKKEDSKPKRKMISKKKESSIESVPVISEMNSYITGKVNAKISKISKV